MMTQKGMAKNRRSRTKAIVSLQCSSKYQVVMAAATGFAASSRFVEAGTCAKLIVSILVKFTSEYQIAMEIRHH